MGEPAHLLPPELAVDEEPISAAVLDDLIDTALVVAADCHIDPEEAVTDPEHQPWQIEDEGAAEWAMRHLAATDANLAALDQQAAEYVQRIALWHQDARRRVSVRRAFFAGQLEAYGIRRRLVEPKLATINLPSGKIATTDHRPKIEVGDEAAVIEWVDENLPAVMADQVAPTTRKVLVSELRKVAAVADQPTGRVTLALACGCEVTRDSGDTIEDVDSGAMDCPTEHGPQPIVNVTVESVKVAVTEDGEKVPGVVVTPRHYSAKASPA